jgi:hypothetical protein
MNAVPSASPDYRQAPEAAPQKPVPCHPFTLTVRGYGAFDLLWGRWDVFARWNREREWLWLREGASVEIGAGRWRVTVSWDIWRTHDMVSA